ncbi:MAG: hypothetical protein KAJ55_14590, partial [Anaerolineales bacterium]|nr:hypothetical protein [Anaerolineales bacterium]
EPALLMLTRSVSEGFASVVCTCSAGLASITMTTALSSLGKRGLLGVDICRLCSIQESRMLYSAGNVSAAGGQPVFSPSTPRS